VHSTESTQTSKQGGGLFSVLGDIMEKTSFVKTLATVTSSLSRTQFPLAMMQKIEL
jgi:hypothetical protein